MQTVGPVMQKANDAVPCIRPGLRVWHGFVMVLALASCAALAAPGPGAKSAEAQGKHPAAADFVGAETCANCHEEVAKGFGENPHRKMAQMHGGSAITCENCHGPGREHVEGGGDASKIFNPAKASAKEVDKTCLTCHAGAHPNFDRSPHAKANVGCTSCHSVHNSEDKEQLLKASQPKLCFQCHSDTKASFSMPFHHKVNEGLVSCSDCHDPHGSFEAHNLKSTADQNAVCTKCHTETRGPFVFEHAPVKVEGCVGCHTPHGSQNARLLNMPNINTLCKQCHSSVAADAVHGMGAGSTSAQQCTSCHTYIHGSNMNWAFIK